MCRNGRATSIGRRSAPPARGFAFIKATEGGDHLDPKFLQNWYGAKAAGVPRGAYHMLYWCRPASEQALWFMLNVPYDPDALPPVLDLEWNHHSRSCPNGAPADVALEKIKIMLDVMESHTGKRPIIYTDVAFYRDVLSGELKDYNFWLRSVAAEPQAIYGDRPWLFWQFTTTGHVPGIAGVGRSQRLQRLIRRLASGLAGAAAAPHFPVSGPGARLA